MIFVSDHLIEVHRDLLQTYRSLGRDEYVRKESMRLNTLIAIKNCWTTKNTSRKHCFDMAHSALYKRIMNSKEWIALRNKKRQHNPLCECCIKEGKVVPMYAVHHIQEVESGRSVAECWELALAESNLMSVCSECHRKLHEGSHTREASRKRKEDRLAAWISQQEGGRSV